MDVRFADLANLSLVGAGAVSAGPGAGLPVELLDRARKGTSQVTGAIHLAANEPSLGLFHVHEHIRRSVPLLVERKRELRAYDSRVLGVLHDVEYTREVTGAIGAITSFAEVQKSIRHTIRLKQEIDRAAAVGFRVETMQSFHFRESSEPLVTMPTTTASAAASVTASAAASAAASPTLAPTDPTASQVDGGDQEAQDEKADSAAPTPQGSPPLDPLDDLDTGPKRKSPAKQKRSARNSGPRRSGGNLQFKSFD